MTKFTDFQIMILERGQIGCEDVASLLGDYQDNELPLSLKGRVDSHIKQCGECAEVVRGYRMVVELARELKDPPMPEGVSERLRRSLNKKLGLNLNLSR